MAGITKSTTPCFLDQLFCLVACCDFALVPSPFPGVEIAGINGISRNATVFGDQACDSPQPSIRKPCRTNQANGTKKKACQCPTAKSMRLVLGDISCTDTARNPDSQKCHEQKKDAHRPINAVLMVRAMDQLAHPQSGGEV